MLYPFELRAHFHNYQPARISCLELLKADRPKESFREQTGSVVKRADGFYIRFYRDGENGAPTKVTERLRDLSVVDPKKRALLQRSHMSIA
jgi:hypothetical protein